MIKRDRQPVLPENQKSTLWSRFLRLDPLVRNSTYIMATTVVTSLLGFVYWTIAAHRFPAHDVGLAAALVSAMTVATTLSSAGLNSALIQTLPQRSSGGPWSITLTGGLIAANVVSFLVGLAVVVALPFFSSQFAILNTNRIYAFALLASILVWTTSGLLDNVFIAERSSQYMFIRNAIFALVKIPLLVVPAFAAAGALGIFGSWLLATALTTVGALVVLVPRLRRDYSIRVRGALEQLKDMRSLIAGHHFTNVGNMLPAFLLPALVAGRLSATDNAYFYTTWMVCSVLFIVSPAVASALFAEGSHIGTDLQQKVKMSIIIIGVLIGAGIVIYLAAGQFILSIFGTQYPRHGLTLLQVSVVAAIPDAVTNIYVVILRVKRRLRDAAFLTIGMGLVTLGLSWVLLPKLGVSGVGWAWLAAQSLGTLYVAGDVVYARVHLRAVLE
jgi:O-antigen/teichoic acid export membrane protein